MTVATAVSLLVALAALAISATSLWHGAVKPADIELEHLDEHCKVHGGGMNGVPGIYGLELTVALANLGARAGLLQSLAVESVTAPGAPEFATGAVGSRHSDDPGTPAVIENKMRVVFPKTVEAGDVRAFKIGMELKGAFQSEAQTTYLEPPSKEPLAQLLAGLQQVELRFAWSYRRRVGLFGGRTRVKRSTLAVSIPGHRFRDPAVEYWRGDWPELAEIVESGGP
jgi:hypothetical protein